jgi:bifunctional non-homologous end joining protein LigD
MQPFTPMSPILQDRIPEGEEWIHQLKWDGFRIIAWVDNGKVELFSKKMLPKNRTYPDLVAALSHCKGTLLLDGEAVILDDNTRRPSFQRMQQRDKLTDPGLIRRAASRQPVQYILFDLLQLGRENLRGRPFQERIGKLLELTSGWAPPLFPADVFEDGKTLWDWVVANGWEGVVSKRRSGIYKEGKDHHDWVKRKTVLHFDVEIVGVIWKEGRVSSLVMCRNGHYFGRISSGLNDKAKAELRLLQAEAGQKDYFFELPEGLRGADVRWLNQPLEGRVAGRETTEHGLLRHPKLLDLGGISL